MASQEIGSLFVALGLDSAAFTAGVKRVQGVTSKLQNGFQGIADKAESMGRKLSVVSGAMAAFGLAAGGLVKHTADAASEIRRQSQLANAGTDEFQRMAAGARRVGIDQEKLAGILKDVNDRVGEFNATGSGPMLDFFENVAPKVGVTADMFKGLSGPEALQLYVSSLEKAGLSQQQMTFYLEAMASDATALIPLLKNGGAEMTRLGDAAQASGAVMSAGLIAKSKEFSDKLTVLSDSINGVKNRLAEALLPIVNQLLDTLTTKGIPALESMVTAIEGLITWFGSLSQPVQEAAAVIATALGVGGPVLIAVAALSRGFALLLGTGPIGLFIGAAALAVAAWRMWGDDIKALWQSVTESVSTAWQTIDQTMQSALEAVRAKQAQIEQFFVDGWNAIIEYLKTLPAKFLEIGGQIVDGLKAGITAKWDAMTAWFQDKADRLVADFKSIFDIQSPSRVFQAIGRFITEGLGLGLQEGVSEVEGGMKSVADAVNGDGLAEGMFKFRDAARDVFSQVAFQGKKLGDVLKSMAASWLSNTASNLFTTGFNGLWGALGLPSNANGTDNFAGGLTRVNERGGEIMNLPGGTQIIPHDISKRMADRSGGGALNVTVTMDPSTGALSAFVRNQAGQVVAQAAPALVRQSVAATYEKAREYPLGKR